MDFIYRRNSTVAYLEYSAFFLNHYLTANAGGVYGNPSDRHIRGGLFVPLVASVGHLSPTADDYDDIGSAMPPMVTGTWKGGMIGVAYGNYNCGDTCTYEQLSPRPLTGNVTFTLSTAVEGRDSAPHFPYKIEFSNIVDTDGEKMAGWTWTGKVWGEYGYGHNREPLFLDAQYQGGGEFSHSDSGQGMRGHFYGPNYEEIGGVFSRRIPAGEVTEGRNKMDGSFGARRQ